jgi:Stealth protein CR4, conserved region 4/Stealth protein CR3, conserved region 3
MERRHPEDFARVARSRFRHPDDLSVPSALAHYYAYCLGRAVPGTLAYAYQDIKLPDLERRLANLERNREIDVFCLNDNDTTPAQRAMVNGVLARFFGRYFPLASPFETPADA